MKVRVYKNLHRNCWSIQEYIQGQGWRVWNYYTELVIDNPKFIVYEKGRQRVIETGKKNVHAYVQGELKLTDDYAQNRIKMPPKFRPEYHLKINYNPKTDEFFQIGKSGIKPDRELTEVYLDIEYGVYI